MTSEFESGRYVTAVESLPRPGAVQLYHLEWVPTLDSSIVRPVRTVAAHDLTEPEATAGRWLGFERFVTERLKRALRGRLDVKSQHCDRLDEDRRVVIRPDLLFSSQGTARFVADIKYKLTDEGARGRAADYYQLLAYTTALDLPYADRSGGESQG